MASGNLLILMSDEHQARAMGCAGHPFVHTPILDRMAAEGMRFTDAYTPCPICVPARAAFASGQYVHQNRLWDNAMPYVGAPRSWGHALQGAGVPVESIGKLHYRYDDDDVGFDASHISMQAIDGVGMVWGSIRREGERARRPGRMLGDYVGPGTSKYTEFDDAVVARTGKWLNDRIASGDARPWCLYVGLVAPHFPLVAPDKFYDLYPRDTLPKVKLHPSDGYVRHPWVEAQVGLADTEGAFRDGDERLAAMSAYYGLCTSLDHNIGLILDALNSAGFGDNTTVIYTSDHGDNVGARGTWGKSNLYQESVSIPLIIAGPDVPVGTCDTPVSLLDVSATIPNHFGADFDCQGKPLGAIADAPADLERPVLSEYHAIGAVSGAFMLRKGRWKYNHYVGFRPELFDLWKDPEELEDLAGNPAFSDVLKTLETEMRKIVDMEAADAQAFADQDAMIESYGGREAALKMGASGATPPPKVTI